MTEFLRLRDLAKREAGTGCSYAFCPPRMSDKACARFRAVILIAPVEVVDWGLIHAALILAPSARDVIEVIRYVRSESPRIEHEDRQGIVLVPSLEADAARHDRVSRYVYVSDDPVRTRVRLLTGSGTHDFVLPARASRAG